MTTTDTLLALLEESEVTADEELGLVLADLQALGAGPVPAPGPELAALLVSDGRRRSRLHRRGVVVGALVVLSLGTGVTAAAASPDVREGAVGVIAAAAHVLQPPAAVPHRTAAPGDVPVGRPSAAPSPAAVPALPAAGRSSSDSRGTRGEDAARHAAAANASHGRGRSGSSGSHDGTGPSAGSGRGPGHGSSASSDTGSKSSGSGTHGAGSGSRHGAGSGGSSGGGD